MRTKKEENVIKDADIILKDLMVILQIMIDRQEVKIRDTYLNGDVDDYVRFIDDTARRDTLNSVKSYLIGRLNEMKLPIEEHYRKRMS